MEIKCNLFASDLSIIHENMKEFQSDFTGLEILGKSLVPDDEYTAWEGEPEDMYEVTFKIQSMNHFWAMAKRVGKIDFLQLKDPKE